MPERRGQLRGHLYAVAAGAGFGTLGPFSKLFYAHGGRPFELLTLRCAGTAVLLGTFAALRPGPRPRPRAVLAGLGLGAFQLGANVTLLTGFDVAPAALVVLLFYVYPMLVTIGAAILFREELGLHRAAVVVVGLVGIALTVGAPGAAPLEGVLLGIGAALFTCTYLLVSRHLLHGARLEPVDLVALMYVGPAVALGLTAGVRGFHAPDAAGFGWAAAIVLVSSVFALTLWYTALKRIGAGTTALLSTVEPLVGVLLAYLVLGESLTALQLLGGALILGSVASLTRPLRFRRPAPVPHA